MHLRHQACSQLLSNIAGYAPFCGVVEVTTDNAADGGVADLRAQEEGRLRAYVAAMSVAGKYADGLVVAALAAALQEDLLVVEDCGRTEEVSAPAAVQPASKAGDSGKQRTQLWLHRAMVS
jgi:hypothetical protein